MNQHFLLSDNGSYLALGYPNHSNYDGFFVRLNTYWKTIANITPTSGAELESVVENKRTFADGSSQIFTLAGCLRVTLNGSFLLTLDCKQLYDESSDDRHYIIDIREGEIHIRYKELYMILSTQLGVEWNETWREVSYSYDDRRGTTNNRWVYDVLTVSGVDDLVFGVGYSEEEARATMSQQPQEHPAHFSGETARAWQALSALRTETGIMAGLPWFYKEWSRDELISLGGLLVAREYNTVIKILDKWYNAVHDGRLPAIYPDEGLTSIDAPGWLGRRTLDLLHALLREGIPLPPLDHWREQAAALLASAPIRDGLVWNERNETWMDTDSNDAGRAGARIEIQALYTALADAHAMLCALTGQHCKKYRFDVTRLVHDGQLLDGLYADGTPDTTIRPNIFLAWYAYPDLFPQAQWTKFFTNVLDALWLAWGGLASIDKHDQNFHSNYTGEDVASYHRGDSWYYVNNIAALALAQDKKFHTYVDKIIEASVTDLDQGIVGHCSELSSASFQEPCGCHAQAWSASTLLELLMTLK